MRKVLLALVVWLVVSLILELIGKALKDSEGVGLFLVNNNVLLGLLAGIFYYFFSKDTNRS